MPEEFRNCVGDSGVDFDTLTNDEKGQWRERFDKFNVSQQKSTGKLHSTAFFLLFLS